MNGGLRARREGHAIEASERADGKLSAPLCGWSIKINLWHVIAAAPACVPDLKLDFCAAVRGCTYAQTGVDKRSVRESVAEAV